MSSLVSDFIINPVLRQARRFSSGFATDEQHEPSVQTLQQQHHQTRSAGESSDLGTEIAILESEEDRRIPTTTRYSAATPLGGIDPASNNPPQTQIHNPVSSTDEIPRDLSALSFSPPSSREIERESQLHQASSPSSASPLITPWTASGVRDLTLPEDDGMGPLRRRILAVQATDISQELKAQLVHQILMEGHTKAQISAPCTPKLGSPTANYTVPESSEVSGPLQQALKFLNPLGDGSGPLALPLSEEDRRPTYVPTTRPEDADDDDFVTSLYRARSEDSGQPALGCQHYQRNVKLQCATCEKWYTCRFCHDAAEDHTLPRKETKNMLCMLCGCPQKASDTCIRCGESASQYYCGVCKLWNDDPNKSIYHCNDCGLCRVGQGLGKDFFHCKKCMACISMTGGHKCIERSIDCDCPICGEYMFNSPRPVVFMQCGHSIHRHCFNEHMNSSYKCPICNKSCVNMEYQFRNYDIAILTQPMPAEYRDSRAIISCNDCSAKSQTAYHWLGLKCTVCNSYNTIQHQLLNMPGNATTAAAAGLPPTTGAFNHGEQRNMAADAARILREIRRTQQAEENGGVVPQETLPQPRHDTPTTTHSVPPSGTSSPGDRPATPTIVPSAAIAAGITAGELAYLARAGGLVLATETPDDSEAEDEEDGLDFWGNDAEYIRRNFAEATFAEAGHDNDNDEEDEGDDNDSSGDDCGLDTDEDDDDDDDDDVNEIVLLGHR